MAVSSRTNISFDNTEIAYKNLSNSDLQRTHWLFSIMNQPWMVKMGSKATLIGLQLHLPIKGLIKSTIYRQFCGGETLDQATPVVQELAKNQLEVLLNYSVEGLEDEKSFYETYQQALQSIEFASKHKNIRAICLKFTGYGRIELFEKIQAGKALNEQEQKEVQTAKKYIDEICEKANAKNVQIYVDAEESWFQDTIDAWVDEMMEKYNKESAIIFNTFQLYRNDKLEFVKKSIARAKERGYFLGAKLVRGAYVEKENKYAQEHGIPSPIHTNKKATDQDFNEALKTCIDNISIVSICCATHNEESCLKAVQWISELASFKKEHFCFSQLYGMGDYISNNLADQQYTVAKYLPYGPVKDVIPYLIRRAQENTSVEGQTSRELMLIKKEVSRRKL